jgi:hypothetical protein
MPVIMKNFEESRTINVYTSKRVNRIPIPSKPASSPAWTIVSRDLDNILSGPPVIRVKYP